MSSIALTGLLTGLAQGAAARMDEEREEAKNNLELQIKSTYTNMQKYNSVLTDLESEIRKRDEKIRQFAPDLEDNYRIAAATMPDLLPVYFQLLNKGEKVNIRDLIKVGEKASGSSFDNWVSNLKTMGLAEPSVDMFTTQKDSFFAPSAESQQKMAGQMAKSLGTSVEELSRFKTVPSVPTLAGYGSFAPEFTAKLATQKSIDQQLTEVRGRYAEIASTKGEDDPQAKELFDLNTKLTGYKKNLDPKEADWASTVNALKQKKYEAELSGDKKAIAEADRQIAAYMKTYEALTPKTEKDRQESIASLRSLANDSIATYLRREYGELFLKKLLVLQPDGGITYGGNDVEIQRRKAQIEVEASIKVLNPWINNGVPIDDRVKSVLIAKGVQFDNQGRVLMNVPPIGPRAEQPAKPGAAKPVPAPGTLQSVPTNPISQAASGATQTPRVITEAQLETFIAKNKNKFTRNQAIEHLKAQGVTVAGAQ